MASMTQPELPEVVGGVDSHKDRHVATAVNAIGHILGVATFAATPSGYAQSLAWLRAFGPVSRSGWRAPARGAQA